MKSKRNVLKPYNKGIVLGVVTAVFVALVAFGSSNQPGYHGAVIGPVLDAVDDVVGPVPYVSGGTTDIDVGANDVFVNPSFTFIASTAPVGPTVGFLTPGSSGPFVVTYNMTPGYTGPFPYTDVFTYDLFDSVDATTDTATISITIIAPVLTGPTAVTVLVAPIIPVGTVVPVTVTLNAPALVPFTAPVTVSANLTKYSNAAGTLLYPAAMTFAPGSTTPLVPLFVGATNPVGSAFITVTPSPSSGIASGTAPTTVVAGAPAQLVFDPSFPLTTPAGTPTVPFVVRLVDLFGNTAVAPVNTDLALETDSAALGALFRRGGLPISNVNIPAGSSQTDPLTYENTVAGTDGITVRSEGYAELVGDVIITASGPAQLIFVPSFPLTTPVTTPTPTFVVRLVDLFGNTAFAPVNTNLALETDSGSLGALFRRGGVPVTNTNIPAGSSDTLPLTYENTVAGTDGITVRSEGYAELVGDVIITATAPAAPVATPATGITATSLNANWLTVPGAVDYRLTVATDPALLFPLLSYTNVTATGTTLPVTGLIPGTQYFYGIKANNGTSLSPLSNIISATTPAPAPVATPATAITGTGFTSNWLAAPVGIVNYRLDVSTIAGFTSYVPGYLNLSVPSTQLSNVVTGLTPGTYFYRVRAQYPTVTSANSNVITVATTVAVPAAPVVSTSSPTINSFVGSWPAVPTATSYSVEVSLSPSFSTLLAGYPQSTTLTSINVTGLNPSTVYYIRVRAVNAGGNSAYSNVAQATTLAVHGAACTGAGQIAIDFREITYFNNQNVITSSDAGIRTANGISGAFNPALWPYPSKTASRGTQFRVYGVKSGAVVTDAATAAVIPIIYDSAVNLYYANLGSPRKVNINVGDIQTGLLKGSVQNDNLPGTIKLTSARQNVPGILIAHNTDTFQVPQHMRAALTNGKNKGVFNYINVQLYGNGAGRYKEFVDVEVNTCGDTLYTLKRENFESNVQSGCNYLDRVAGRDGLRLNDLFRQKNSSAACGNLEDDDNQKVRANYTVPVNSVQYLPSVNTADDTAFMVYGPAVTIPTPPAHHDDDDDDDHDDHDNDDHDNDDHDDDDHDDDHDN